MRYLRLLTVAVVAAALAGCTATGGHRAFPPPRFRQKVFATRWARFRNLCPIGVHRCDDIAPLGGKAMVLGIRKGEQLTITLTKMIYWAPGSRPPARGRRWIVARFRLANTGTVDYADNLAGQTAGYSLGRAYVPVPVIVRGCRPLTGITRIAPGTVLVGCLVFSFPVGAHLGRITITMDHGRGRVGGF